MNIRDHLISVNKNSTQNCLDNIRWERSILNWLAFAPAAGWTAALLVGIAGLLYYGYPGWKKDQSASGSYQTDWIIFGGFVVLTAISAINVLRKSISFFRDPEFTVKHLTEGTQDELRLVANISQLTIDEHTPLNDVINVLTNLVNKNQSYNTFGLFKPLISFDQPILRQGNEITTEEDEKSTLSLIV